MATFKEIQDRVLDYSKRAGLTDVGEIRALINEVYLEMSSLLRPTVTDESVTLIAGIDTYSMAGDWGVTDVQAIRHLVILDSDTNQSYTLERAQTDYLLKLQQNQAVAAGAMRWWAQDGLDRVVFYPGPSAATTNLLLTYVARPALLAADLDVPLGIPVEFHDVIVLGAVSRALRFWSPERARAYHQDYRQGIQEYRQWANRRGGTWAPRAIVIGSRSNLALHDNSRDTRR